MSADVVIDRAVTKYMSVLQHHFDELVRIFGNLPDIPDSPPTKEESALCKELLEASKVSLKAAESVYLSLVAEISVYESDEKKISQRTVIKNLWERVQTQANTLKQAQTLFSVLCSPLLVENPQSHPFRLSAYLYLNFLARKQSIVVSNWISSAM